MTSTRRTRRFMSNKERRLWWLNCDNCLYLIIVKYESVVEGVVGVRITCHLLHLLLQLVLLVFV